MDDNYSSSASDSSVSDSTADTADSASDSSWDCGDSASAESSGDSSWDCGEASGDSSWDCSDSDTGDGDTGDGDTGDGDSGDGDSGDGELDETAYNPDAAENPDTADLSDNPGETDVPDSPDVTDQADQPENINRPEDFSAKIEKMCDPGQLKDSLHDSSKYERIEEYAKSNEGNYNKYRETQKGGIQEDMIKAGLTEDVEIQQGQKAAVSEKDGLTTYPDIEGDAKRDFQITGINGSQVMVKEGEHIMIESKCGSETYITQQHDHIDRQLAAQMPEGTHKMLMVTSDAMPQTEQDMMQMTDEERAAFMQTEAYQSYIQSAQYRHWTKLNDIAEQNDATLIVLPNSSRDVYDALPRSNEASDKYK